MDALSQALSSVHMTGAIFFNVECTAPWGFAVPPVDEAAPVLAPGTERLVNYHLVTEGRAHVQLEGADPLALRAGDVIVLPHGDPHTVCNGAPTHIAESGEALGSALKGRPRTLRLEGGGEPTNIICGFFGCNRNADRLFLAGLPHSFKIHLRDDSTESWLERSVQHLAGEAERGRPGADVLLSKMAEALFIETLRRYMQQLPPEQTGWLAGARDPVVGGALARLHEDPSRAWTLDDLASEVGASRSVLGERFARFLGESPMAYLARWRLQLAARSLETTDATVLHIALEVGYQSESAFSRAFKRELGVPPAQYRKQHRPRSTGPRE